MGLYRQLTCRALWIAVAGLTACAPALAGETTEQFFRELRERRLFSIAEAYCLEQLSDASISPERRAELAVELSRTFVEHAKFAGGREHDELWDRAVQTVDDVLAADRDNPRRSFLEAQRARVPAVRGEFLRRQWESSPHDETLRNQAVETLADAVERLRLLEGPLERRHDFAVQSARRPAREPLSGWELKMLLKEVRYELGAALIGQAALHPKSSAERAAALSGAEEVLRPLAGGPADEDVTPLAQIRLAEVYRLIGEARRATAQLSEVERNDPPLRVLNVAVAERVRLILDESQPDDAAQLLSRYRQLYRQMPGELWFLDVRSLLGMWRIAVEKSESELAADLMKRVEESVARSEREAGGHWAWRCRLLLEQARQSSQYGPELAEAIRQAQAAYANGRLDDAIAAYGEAAQTALETSRPDAAFDLFYTRASVQLHSGRYEEAEAEFRRIADEYPDHEQSAAAHLLSAWCLGRIYDRNRTEGARLAYVEALTRHRERYHPQPTAYDAVWMLAALEERRLQATAALKLYGEIPPGHPRGADAQVAVARCYEIILERLREHVRHADVSRREVLRRRLRDWEVDAITRLEAIAAEISEIATRQQAEFALRLARIQLNTPRPNYAAADRMLARAFDAANAVPTEQTEEGESQPSPMEPWGPLLNVATQLRIVSLAGQGKVAEAEQFLQGLSGSSPAEALGVLDGFSQIAADADDSIRQDVGELQLAAAQELNRRRDELSADERRRLDNCLAQAYVATRQPKRAIQVYENLLAAAPRDRRLLATVARLLMEECGTPECLQAAKQHWRTLESFDSPGSEPWLQARLNVARTSLALREYDECRKLLGVTKLLYPTLGTDELREQFRELERRLDAVASR